MRSSMISILTAIVLGLMIQPVTAQNHQGHGGGMHQHMMQMMEDCPMMGDRDMDHSEMMEMMQRHPMFEGEDMSHSEMMEKMQEMDHSEKMEFMKKHPMMEDKDMDHSEMMEMMEKCPMMQGDKDEDGDSDSHDAHH